MSHPADGRGHCPCSRGWARQECSWISCWFRSGQDIFPLYGWNTAKVWNIFVLISETCISFHYCKDKLKVHKENSGNTWTQFPEVKQRSLVLWVQRYILTCESNPYLGRASTCHSYLFHRHLPTDTISGHISRNL